MAQTYTVSYNINVNAEQATTAIRNFTTAAESLAGIGKQFTTFAQSVNTLSGSLAKLSKPYTITFNVTDANTKLDGIIARLERINALAKGAKVITVRDGVGRSRQSTSKAAASQAAQSIYTKPVSTPMRPLSVPVQWALPSKTPLQQLKPITIPVRYQAMRGKFFPMAQAKALPYYTHTSPYYSKHLPAALQRQTTALMSPSMRSLLNVNQILSRAANQAVSARIQAQSALAQMKALPYYPMQASHYPARLPYSTRQSLAGMPKVAWNASSYQALLNTNKILSKATQGVAAQMQTRFASARTPIKPVATPMKALPYYPVPSSHYPTLPYHTMQSLAGMSKPVWNFSALQGALGLSKPMTLVMNTKAANAQLDYVANQIKAIRGLAASPIVMGGGASTLGANTANGSTTNMMAATGQGTASNQKSKSQPKGSRSVRAGGRGSSRGNYTYRALGPSMIDSGGIGAISMLKGMGLMYGITGLGSLMGNILHDSTDYDNIIQTTRNILQSHDMRENFGRRFANMESIIRQVGLATKYTAPQVADASKFLAMAGFNVEEINQAIRPIADIALIGDTDLGSTADMVTNIMTGYAMQANEVRNAADVMTMTFTSSNTTLTQLAEAYKYSASILHSGGVNFETATAALGILGNAGLQGSHGGTTMRMIMNNLANPTKRQKKQWEALGISPTDSRGKIRPINEIFRELNAKGVGLEEMTRLFRITAAPGATVLAKNVDEWEKIIKENYGAQGISGRLALEKQNTIQGLWAQITSQLTENGLLSFEGMQSQIRGFMRELLNWMRSADAKKYVSEFAQMLMDLIKMFKEFTLVLLECYHRFGPLIKVWLEFQVKMSAILIPLRIFRSLFNFGGMVLGMANAVGRFSTTLGGLIVRMRSLNALSAQWQRTKWAMMYGLGATNFGNIPPGGVKSVTTAVGNVHKNVDKKTMVRYQNMLRRNQSLTALRTGMVGVAGGVGGIIGAVAGSHIGETGSGLNMAATIGGGLLGAAALGALSSTPWAWAAAGTVALGALAYKTYQSIKAAKAGQQAWSKFIDSFKVENGLYTGENMTIQERYYELVYNKSLSLTEVTEKRVQLLKEELALKNGEVKDGENRLIDRQVLDFYLGEAKGADQTNTSTPMANLAAANANKLRNGLVRHIGPAAFNGYRGGWYWNMGNGQSLPINNPRGTNDSQDALAALTALYAEGYEGTQTKAIISEYQNKLRAIMMTGGGWEEVAQLRKEILERFSWSNYVNKAATDTRPESMAYGYQDLQDGTTWNSDKIGSAYTFRQGTYNKIVDTFFREDGAFKIAKDYYDNLKAGTLTEDMVKEYMMAMDPTTSSVLRYFSSEPGNGEGQVGGWLASLGLQDGQFKKSNAELALFQTHVTNVLSAFNMLNQKSQEAAWSINILGTYLDRIATGQLWYNSQGGATRAEVDKGSKRTIGETYTIDGDTYVWDGKNWNLKTESEYINLPTQLTNKAMEQIQRSEKNAGSSTDWGANTDSSQFLSSYQNTTSTTAKPVSVHIDNLMSIQNAEMMDRDKLLGMVDGVKEQVTQMFVDIANNA